MLQVNLLRYRIWVGSIALACCFIVSLQAQEVEDNSPPKSEVKSPSELPLELLNAEEPESSRSLTGKIKDKLKLTGYFQSRFYQDFIEDNDREHGQEWRQDLRIETEFNPVEQLRIVLSADGRLDPVRNKRDGITIEEKTIDLWEAYVSTSWGPLNLSIGKKVIRWGKSDELNPTDNFTPEDFSELLNHDRTDRKLPAWMLHSEVFLDEFVFETVWQPFFEGNRGAPSDSDWYFPGLRDLRQLGLRVDSNRKTKQLRNHVLANRLLYRGENTGFDAGLSYAYHFNETPSVHIEFPFAVLRNHRQHTFGAEFETVIGAYGVRGEMAYSTRERYATDSLTDSDKVTARDRFNFILGMDRTFPFDIYVNLQYSGNYIFDYSRDMTQPQYDHQALLNLSRKFMRDKLVLSFSGRYAFQPSDYYLFYEVSYKFTNYMEARLNFSVFGGSGDGIFNAFNQNDQVGLEVKISF